MKKYKVELISTSDPYTQLKSGDVGELIETKTDPFTKTRVLTVKWKSGSSLRLIEGEDNWRVYEEN